MVSARLPRPPPTQRLSKGESTAPKSQDKDKAKEDKEAVREKTESLQQVLDDLPEDSPLRPDVEAQLQNLQGQLEDKRSKGARLDSAEARLRRAEASLAKKEQAMEDAAKALEEAKQEAEEAQKTLEEVRAIMVPNTVAEQPEEEETVLKSSSAWRTSTTSTICCTTCRPGFTTAARRNGLPRKAVTTRERARPSPRTTRRPTRSCTEPWATWVQWCPPGASKPKRRGATHPRRGPVLTPPFVREHLRKIATLVTQDCVKIQHLPEHLVAQEAGMQLGFALLQRTLPSRILHLLRATELCEKPHRPDAHHFAKLAGTPGAQRHPLASSPPPHYGRRLGIT